MSFEGANWPGEIHIYTGTLTDPSGFGPREHVHVVEKLPWFDTADTLPRKMRSGSSHVSTDTPG